jgi:acyl carrier protein
MSDISEKVLEIISEKLDSEIEGLTAATHFVNDLGADSLDTVELIMEFEKEFDISIKDEEASEITTVGAAIEFIEKASPKNN